MTLNNRISAFSKLGELILNHFDTKLYNEKIAQAIISAGNQNQWFTKEQVEKALLAIASNLNSDKITRWLSNYPELKRESTMKNIAVVMAGNIPLVGFHDFLSVLISGHSFIGKLSSKDDCLMKLIVDLLISVEPEFSKLIHFENEYFKKFNAIIATGSNNTSRYFDYYFGKYPNIIRRNRSSIAILSGKETTTELELLADDIFTYFGLGCRNVSKLFIPGNYQIEQLIDHFVKYQHLGNHNKYANNYDYNKSIYIMNGIHFTDGNFFLMKEDPALDSPTSVIYYEYYTDFSLLQSKVKSIHDSIQCIVGNLPDWEVTGLIPFGKAQQPELWDYADNIDTIKFLTGLQ